MQKNWNVDKTKLEKIQADLKQAYKFNYVGNGPKATGFLAGDFKRKPGLFIRCFSCGYYMPLDAKGEEQCMCGSLIRDERNVKCEFGKNEVEVFKGVKK